MRPLFGLLLLTLVILELLHQCDAPPQMAMLTVATGQGTQFFDGWPPARYAYSPKQPVSIRFARDQDEIDARCGKAPDTLRTEGCASVGKPSATMPNPCTFDEHYAQLLCHELGHVNGWPAKHPR